MAKKTKRGAGLQKKIELSAELADFMNADSASRPEVTKKIWAYIKKHGLNDGRTINPDDTLAELVGSSSFDMLQLAKKLKKHFIVD